jgi:hypothetical protein
VPLTLKGFGTDNPPHPPLALRARPSRSRQPPTLAAGRFTLTLPLPPTLAGLRWTGGSLTHVGQACQHCAETVKQSQQSQDLRLWGEVEDQYAFQRCRGLARLAARTAEQVTQGPGRRMHCL